MKQNTLSAEGFESTYALLVRSEEKERSMFEGAAYLVFILERGLFDLARGATAGRVAQRRCDPHHVGRAIHGDASASLIDNAVQENSVAITRCNLFRFRRALPGGGERGRPLGRFGADSGRRAEAHRRSVGRKRQRLDRIDYRSRLRSEGRAAGRPPCEEFRPGFRHQRRSRETNARAKPNSKRILPRTAISPAISRKAETPRLSFWKKPGRPRWSFRREARR